jgi:cytochrome c oxidase cbb3-type subunit 1
MLSLRGSGWIQRDLGLRFVATATVIYLIVGIQGSVQAQMAVNQSVHFSDWVVGHSHLSMLGFASFAAAGGLIHAWQRIPWARYNPMMLELSYWFLLAGVVMMVSDLTVAGLVEARLWQSAAPWIDSVQAARPFWLIRTLSFVPIAGGFLALLAGLITGERGGGLRAIQENIGLQPIQEIAPRLSPVAADLS